MGEFTDLVQLLNQQFAVHKKLPSKVKVNEEWFRLQQFSTWTLHNDSTIAGIPVEVDDTIETFQFVYEK